MAGSCGGARFHCGRRIFRNGLPRDIFHLRLHFCRVFRTGPAVRKRMVRPRHGVGNSYHLLEIRRRPFQVLRLFRLVFRDPARQFWPVRITAGSRSLHAAVSRRRRAVCVRACTRRTSPARTLAQRRPIRILGRRIRTPASRRVRIRRSLAEMRPPIAAAIHHLRVNL